MNWFTWSPLEAWANIFTIVCIFLAGRNSIHTWWTGIIACGLFGILFYDSKLYADVMLQVFFTITSVIGWYNWRNIGIITQPITRVSRHDALNYMCSATIFAAAYGLVLFNFTDAWSPWIDSTVLAFSILGQFLLMGRKLESWPIWFGVNVLSVPLYFSRGLYLTTGLYSVFLIHSVWAFYNWKKEMYEQTV